MSKRCYFVADDRPEAGRGHIVRSWALAEEMARRGWECVFLPEGDRSADADVLVVDLRHDCPDRHINFGTARIVAISDEPGQYDFTDLLVNGGAGADPDMYRDSGARNVLAGPEYALLRPEFRETAWSPEACRANSSRYFDARTVGSHGPYEMAWAMSNHYLTVTAAGMRSLEGACVGAPTILFVESEDQESNARALEAKCAGIVAYTEDYARKLAKDLLKDPDWLARMSAAGRRLVDGLGCKRVADAIEQLCSGN